MSFCNQRSLAIRRRVIWRFGPLTHLQVQIGNQAGDPESHKECVCADERSQGIGHFLHLFIPALLFLHPICQTNGGQRSTDPPPRTIVLLITVLARRSDSLAAGLLLLLLLPVVTFLQLPVHDLANHGGGQEAEQLQHAKDGGVQADWESSEEKD